MKKLFTLLAAVALTASLAQVSAQSKSTGTTPAPGATHTYSITTHEGGSVIWSVTKGDLTESAGDDVTLSASTAYSTDITWADDLTVGDWYFVQVIETVGGCSNTKVLPVQIIENPFYLTLAAGSETACYDGAVEVSLAMTDDNPVITYDHGTATAAFTVTPAGVSEKHIGYSFELGIVLSKENLVPSVTFSGNASIAGNVVTVTDNSPVTVTYSIDNQNVYDNGSDDDAADYTATVSISEGKTINGVSDNGTGAKSGVTAVSRPNTTGISTN